MEMREHTFEPRLAATRCAGRERIVLSHLSAAVMPCRLDVIGHDETLATHEALSRRNKGKEYRRAIA